MAERPKQEWRIEADRTGWKSHIFLNDEDFGRYVSDVKVHIPASGTTVMTLTLVAQRVQVITDPALYLIVGDRRFLVIEDTSESPQDDGLFSQRDDSTET
jgi:hypothetical protein